MESVLHEREMADDPRVYAYVAATYLSQVFTVDGVRWARSPPAASDASSGTPPAPPRVPA